MGKYGILPECNFLQMCSLKGINNLPIHLPLESITQFYLKTHEKDQLQDYEFYMVK